MTGPSDRRRWTGDEWRWGLGAGAARQVTISVLEPAEDDAKKKKRVEAAKKGRGAKVEPFGFGRAIPRNLRK